MESIHRLCAWPALGLRQPAWPTTDLVERNGAPPRKCDMLILQELRLIIIATSLARKKWYLYTSIIVCGSFLSFYYCPGTPVLLRLKSLCLCVHTTVPVYKMLLACAIKSSPPSWRLFSFLKVSYFPETLGDRAPLRLKYSASLAAAEATCAEIISSPSIQIAKSVKIDAGHDLKQQSRGSSQESNNAHEADQAIWRHVEAVGD